MDTITSDQLTQICDVMDLEYYKARVTYSGRGMFGKQCVGFDLDYAGELFKLGAAFAEVLGHDATCDLSPTTDGMGMGIIAYFPRLELAEGDTWDKDSDE